jgi:outer membrane scaffolding protein for murein synthesis (MipA/OmpV family)
VIACLGLSNIAVASQAPAKLEVGVALASQYLADYRGSSEYQTQAIPVPIILYRGERIKIDRRGMRGDIFSTSRFELNVSGEASLNGGSKENELRQGMPELDSAFEFGPSLNVLLGGESFQDGISLRIPLRAVFTVDSSSVDYIGYIANPKLTFRKDNIGMGWRYSANVGGLFGSEKYHDYYYSVDEAFQTELRPSYAAKAGFSGWYFKTGLSRRYQSWFVGVSLRYDNLSGAKFEDSPLVETEDYFSLSLAFAKFLWSK